MNKDKNFARMSPDELIDEREKILQFAQSDFPKILHFNQADFVKTIDLYFNRISLFLSWSYLLSSVHPDKELRDLSEKSVEEISQFLTDLRLRDEFYEAFISFKSGNHYKEADAETCKFVDESIRDFEKNGFKLTSEDRSKLKEIQNELNSLSLQFHRNINDSEEFILLNESEMNGLPESYKLTAKQEDGRFKVSTSYPSYLPFMKYAESSEARKRLYLLYLNRAKDKNRSILLGILKKRKEMSDLLQFKSYSDYALVDKMAKSPDTVLDFESDIRKKIKPMADNDYKLLKQRKQRDFPLETIEKLYPWEKSFYSNKILKESYDINQEELKEYFACDRVIQGIFEIANRLYEIEIKAISVSMWHDSVKTFEIFDKGKKIAEFYLDLFPREGKYNHAAMFGLRDAICTENSDYFPSAALICNFPAPTSELPSLLYHSDVETLFHEFGHLFHHLLSKTRYASQAGTNVVRDFVETPSQFFENWAWNYESLSLFAKHYKSQTLLPIDMFNKLKKSQFFNQGIDTEQQVFYGCLDLDLHLNMSYENEEDISERVRNLQNEMTHFPYTESSYFEASFGHLDGYASAYYGYLWSLVYAEDAFSLFIQNGIFNQDIGMRFRKSILEKGSSRDEMVSLEAFLGRPANTDAFIASLGLDQ